MLSNGLVNRVLESAPGVSIGILGDMFLDRYLEVDRSLDEPSVETGLTAFQVTKVRSHPGAAGTVVANLSALGVGRIIPFAFTGDDGEGHELGQALRATPGVEMSGLVTCPARRTPTYTKPMHNHRDGRSVEDHRLDIKNRVPTPMEVIEAIAGKVEAALDGLDALLVLDQVSEADCGVITAAMRAHVFRWSAALPGKFILADSRESAHLLRGPSLKPNRAECRAALGRLGLKVPMDVGPMAMALAGLMGRTVYLTVGEDGMVVAEPGSAPVAVPAFRVEGPVDPVGAGDSTSAGVLLARAAGATPAEAAAFGCLVASITVRQVGVTGTATPGQVMEQWNRQAGSSA